MRKLVFVGAFIFLISLVAGQTILGPTFQGNNQNEFGGGSSFVSSTVQHAAPGYGVSPQAIGVNQFFGLDPKQSYEYCQERQDFIIQIAPGGCTPQVVRSDLLAEQNVPIFCELQAIQINPVLDTSSIKNIILTSEGAQHPAVAGISYQRPNSALRKYISNQEFAAIDNLGYAVIVLNGGMPENQMPDFINGTLKARIQYGAVNAFGFGLQEPVLKLLSEEEWQKNYVKYGFFDGKAYVRLEKVGGDRVTVGIYADVDHKIDNFVIEKGKTSSERYLAASYCNAGYSISYVEDRKPEVKASFVLDGNRHEVYQGDRFAGGLCQLTKITSSVIGGSVRVKCGGKSYNLKLDQKPVSFVVDGEQKSLKVGETIKKAGEDKSVYFVGIEEYSKKSGKEGLFALFALTDNFDGEYASQLQLFSAGENIDFFEAVDIDEQRPVFGIDVKFSKVGSLEDSVGSRRFEEYFDNAINSYKEIEEIYDANENSKIDGVYAGEKALNEATKLAEYVNKEATQSMLIEEVRERYDENAFQGSLNSVRALNRDEANIDFEVDGINHDLTLKSINKPYKDDSNIEIILDGTNIKNLREVNEYVLKSNDGNSNIQLSDFDFEKVILDAKCKDKSDSGKFEINLGSVRDICEHQIEVKDINFKQEVKIRLNPVNKRLGGTVNFSYGVGIEKRAIELTPDKATRRIQKLNQSIARWEDLNNNLENVVEGMKAACFATAATLQVKNLFSGLGGKAIARQMVMQEKWNGFCANNVGRYNSLDDCYSKNAEDINKDVNLVTNIIQDQQKDIKANDDSHLYERNKGLFNKKTVNYEGAFNSYKKNVITIYGEREVLDKDGGNKVSVSEALKGVSDYETLRRIDLQFRIQDAIGDKNNNPELYENARETLYDDLNTAKIIGNQKEIVSSIDSEANDLGIVGTIRTAVHRYETVGSRERIYDNAVVKNANKFGGLVEGTPITKVYHTNGNWYYVALESSENGEIYHPKYEQIEGSGDKPFVYTTNGSRVEQKDAINVVKEFSEFRHFNSESYKNKYTNPKIRFYETEPYKGMPAVVPFDTNNGWYAATKQTLPAFGNIKSFEDSGRVSSFWVCNVGKNGREEFNFGLGDDICQQMNLFTGQAKDRFQGLSDKESVIIIGNAEKALEQATSQYVGGVKKISILGKTYDVGTPQANIPETQCQNFMSPRDCKLMFNVCDPVICPSSRCNLGGKFQVDSVIQSGIVGSTLLCLPNVREGIAIPVCLTGIHAGIDNYVSILKASKDCLQDSIETGRYTGICDEITAIYQCEFFWKQVGPAVNVLLPKLLESFTGNTLRGGGEYLSVGAAWDNAQSSINYFKQTYAQNSLRAFNVRSTADAGSQICKGFVSTRYPNNFKTLIEADSPTQFTAWFDEIKGSDTVTPSISHYKLFYHIFAGTDSGTQFSVYLKNPEGSSFFQSTGNVIVDTGFISAGDYRSETRDFTAPSGFRELCIRTNFQEECGFKQVSTGFALNYIRDKYIKDQINRKDISTEKECVAGTSVLAGGSPLALVNPNLQSATEEALSPTIYERGIIRICSTENPGKGVDEGRYTNVGICGNSKINCWLDENSIDRAITPGNNVSIDILDESVDDEANKLSRPEDGTIGKLESDVNQLFNPLSSSFASGFEDFERKTMVVLSEIDDLDNLFLTEPERAKVAFLRARVYDALARLSFSIQPKKEETTGMGGDEEGEEEVSIVGENLEPDVAIPEPEEIFCSECGKGIFNICEKEECLTLGNCQFINGVTNSCIPPAFEEVLPPEIFSIDLRDREYKEDDIRFAIKNSDKVNNKCLEYVDLISVFSKEKEIDPLLITSIMQQESSCNLDSYSTKNCRGLMQICSFDLCKNIGTAEQITNDPILNVNCGVNILKKKLNSGSGNFKDGVFTCGGKNVKYVGWAYALRGYNGWGCNGDNDYVEKVNQIYENLVLADTGV